MAGIDLQLLGQIDAAVGRGILFMFLSICCSVSISFILKFHETRRGSRLVALAFNYIVAVAINLFLWQRTSFAALNNTAILLGIVTGVLFVLTFLLIMISVGRLGIAITIPITRVTVALPIITAVLFFGERPAVLQIPGLIMGLVSFYFFGKAADQHGATNPSSWNKWLILGLFLGMGITGINLQVFVQNFPAEPRSGFLCLVFGVAMVGAWFFVWQRRRRIRLFDVKMGLLMGIPNGLSAFCFMSALHYLPDIVVFPVNDVSVVLFSTVGAFLIWREKLNRSGWVALILAIAAIALMNVQLSS